MARKNFKYEPRHLAFIHALQKDDEITWDVIAEEFNAYFEDGLPLDEHGNPKPISTVRQSYYYRMQDEETAEQVEAYLEDRDDYLKQESEAAFSEEDSGEDPEPILDDVDLEDGFYHYDELNQRHIFINKTESGIFATDTLRNMKADYSYDLGPQYGLSIQEVCEKYDISHDMFQLIKRTLKWYHASSPFLPQDFQEHSIDELADKRIQESFEGKEGAYKRVLQKKLNRKMHSMAKKAMEKDWEIQRVMELLNGAIPRLSSTPPQVFQTLPEREGKEMIYMAGLADFHEQSSIWSGDSLLEMNYNKQIRDEIIQDFMQQIYQDVCYNWNYNFKRACFVDVGDVLDGVFGTTIAGTLRIEQDSRGLEAVLRVVDMYKKIYYGMREMFGQVDVYFVPGNHDGPWAQAVHYILKEHFENVDGINIHFHTKYYYSFVIGDSQFLLFHEKAANALGKLPEKAGSKRDALIRFLFMLNGVKEDYARTKHHYILTGHYHTLYVKDNGHYEEIRLPSFSPPDDHAQGLFLLNRPSTLGMVIDQGNGVEIKRRYYTDELYLPEDTQAA